MRGDLLTALLKDSRLSDGARVIACWLDLQEPGEDGYVPMAYASLAQLLHGIPSTETVGRHVRMLEALRWVERRPGGRGQPDRFRLAPEETTGLNGNLAPTSSRDLNLAPTSEPPLNTDSPHLEPGAIALMGGRGEAGRKTMEVAGSSSAPAREAGFPLSEKATELIAESGDRFKGFRGTLTDYLQARVRTDRQPWYVRTLQAWVNGTDQSVFRLENGDRVPDPEIPGMLASALNELLATGEKDSLPKPMKWPDGDIRNLKTKLSVLCRQRGDYARPAPRGSSTQADELPALSQAQFDVWLRLREEAEQRGIDPETAARDTYEQARRSA